MWRTARTMSVYSRLKLGGFFRFFFVCFVAKKKQQFLSSQLARVFVHFLHKFHASFNLRRQKWWEIFCTCFIMYNVKKDVERKKTDWWTFNECVTLLAIPFLRITPRTSDRWKEKKMLQKWDMEYHWIDAMLSQRQVQKQVQRSFLPPASNINQCHLDDGKFMMALREKKMFAKEREKNLNGKKR